MDIKEEFGGHFSGVRLPYTPVWYWNVIRSTWKIHEQLDWLNNHDMLSNIFNYKYYIKKIRCTDREREQ